MKLHEEAVAKGDLKALKSVEDTRPADVHSHLLAGLLGQKPEEVGSAATTPEVEIDVIKVPDTPEFDKKSYQRLKQHRSQVPLLSHSISSLTSSLRTASDNESVDLDYEEYSQNVTTNEQHTTVNETEVFVKNYDKNIIPDLNESAVFVEKLDNGDDEVNRKDSDCKTPVRIEENSVSDSKDDNVSLNSCPAISNSFFEKLEEYSSNVKPDTTNPGMAEDFLTSLEKNMDKTDSDKHSPTGHSLASIEPKTPKLSITDSFVASGAGDKMHYTPLRSQNENVPTHLQSPFVKKIPTDRVTKRKSRRKRKRETKDLDKENEEMMHSESKQTSCFELDSSPDML